MEKNYKLTSKLVLVSKYYDQEKTKLCYEYHVDQFEIIQGEYRSWYENEQPWAIGNYKDGNSHGKYQRWHEDGRRWFIDSNHFKKREHGTEIEFTYENK